MVQNRLKANLPESVYIDLLELKLKLRLNWPDFFNYLCNTIPRPHGIERKYEIKEKIRIFEARLDYDSWVKFNTFAIVFKNNAHAIHFLLQEEKKNVGFLPPA